MVYSIGQQITIQVLALTLVLSSQASSDTRAGSIADLGASRPLLMTKTLVGVDKYRLVGTYNPSGKSGPWFSLGHIGVLGVGRGGEGTI